MNNKVNDILKAWKDKYGENESAYPYERIAEIATNCVSLSSVWLERIKNIKGASLEIALINKEGVISEALHGITADNLPGTMLDILVNGNKKYSKIIVNYFLYKDGSKLTNPIGELEIS